MRLIPILLLLAACPPVDDGEELPLWQQDCPEEGVVRPMDVGEITLNVACQGSGETIVLLHGFPEYWQGWTGVMEHLPGRLIVPDQRGYNLSDKPWAVEESQVEHLVADIVGLVEQVGGPVTLVGHDWGGAVAWAVASLHPELVDRLVIMNAPHLNVFREQLINNPEQTEAFSYVDLFTVDGFEETLAANDFGLLTNMMGSVLTESELAEYKEAWGQPNALRGGLNWYRANFTDSLPNTDLELFIEVPTLVFWGMDDDALLPSNLPGLEDWVSDLTIEEVPGATHWIAHEVPELIAEGIENF